MYKRDLVRYDGDADSLINDVIAYAVESAIDPLGSNPVNVLFDLSVSQDDDVPPSEAYFKRVDEVKTMTRNLGLSDLANSVIDQFKADIELFVKVGDLVQFSVNTWKGDAR